MKRLFILMAASAAIFCSCSQKGPDPVEVEGGRVSGYIEDGIRIYKGIPFAAPPVGELDSGTGSGREAPGTGMDIRRRLRHGSDLIL